MSTSQPGLTTVERSGQSPGTAAAAASHMYLLVPTTTSAAAKPSLAARTYLSCFLTAYSNALPCSFTVKPAPVRSFTRAAT